MDEYDMVLDTWRTMRNCTYSRSCRNGIFRRDPVMRFVAESLAMTSPVYSKSHNARTLSLSSKNISFDGPARQRSRPSPRAFSAILRVTKKKSTVFSLFLVLDRYDSVETGSVVDKWTIRSSRRDCPSIAHTESAEGRYINSAGGYRRHVFRIRVQTTKRELTAHSRYLMQRRPTSRCVAAILPWRWLLPGADAQRAVSRTFSTSS